MSMKTRNTCMSNQVFVYQELMDLEDEKSGDESKHESSEYEEYSESEDEAAPRLKPVFVRKYVWIYIVAI